MAGSGAVAGLGSVADADEAAFANEALKEGGDAMWSERPFEGEAYIFTSHGIVVGEESRETLLYVIVVCVKRLAIRLLVDIKLPDFRQQFTVGLEVHPSHTDIAAMVVAVLHIYITF